MTDLISQENQKEEIIAGRYVIIEKIGMGGTGNVYRAKDTKKNIPVAVKEMTFTFVNKDEEKYINQIFKSEAEMLETLTHPSLPAFIEYLEIEDKKYLVMDFIEGLTLADIMEKENKFIPEEMVKDWAIQLCEVLEYLHNKNPPVIYRDLKPGNIILEESGNIRLIDFGIARRFKAGKDGDTLPFFTEGYAPPEQYCNQTDTRSDIYSLGVTIHHLLTKYKPEKSPFRLPSIKSINKNVSEEFEEIIMKALEVKPGDRWQDIKKLYNALISCQNKGESLITKISFLKKLYPEKITEVRAEKKVPERILVSNTSEGDFRNINKAIKHAKPGSTILVNPGIYRENIRITKDIVIIGNGARNSVIIESKEKYALSMRTYKAIIKNLTLRSGRNNSEYNTVEVPEGHLILEGCNINSSSLACIAVYGVTATISVKGCIIHKGKKGGILFDEKGTGTVEYCDIFNNSPACIVISDASNPSVKKCKIRNGGEYGIYVHNKGFGTIEECDITENAVAGVCIEEQGNPDIKNCNISNNKHFGILVTQKGAGHLEYCNILYNSASGVTITEKGNPLIQKCNIKNSEKFGLYISERGRGIIEKCDILENGIADINVEKNSYPVIKDCKSREKIDCFITTATCLSLGKGDNCYELQSFRKFRDSWLRSEKDGEELIENYYRIAPHIVKNINKIPGKKSIYKNIWQNYLSECLSAIEAGNYKETEEIYRKMVEKLKEIFLNRPFPAH